MTIAEIFLNRTDADIARDARAQEPAAAPAQVANPMLCSGPVGFRHTRTAPAAAIAKRRRRNRAARKSRRINRKRAR